jgi:hypothetical protein
VEQALGDDKLAMRAGCRIWTRNARGLGATFGWPWWPICWKSWPPRPSGPSPVIRARLHEAKTDRCDSDLRQFQTASCRKDLARRMSASTGTDPATAGAPALRTAVKNRAPSHPAPAPSRTTGDLFVVGDLLNRLCPKLAASPQGTFNCWIMTLLITKSSSGWQSLEEDDLKPC